MPVTELALELVKCHVMELALEQVRGCHVNDVMELALEQVRGCLSRSWHRSRS